MDEKQIKKHLFLLVLCGGGGTRLWPRSRNAHPKQFARLLGKETLLQMTINRFKGFLSFEKIFVVTTSNEYGRLVQKQIPQIPKKNIIIEPARRDTAMAHGLGAAYIQKIDPDAVILTESADRPIGDVKAYLRNFLVSAKVASEGNILVTTGVKPDFPHTGLGYVKKGKLEKKIGGKPVYRVEKFAEKPDLKTAQKYQKDKDYYWHTGFYVWKASSYISALKKHAPELGEGIEKILKALGTFKEKRVVKQVYESVPKISVDYAVGEKAKNFYTVIGNFEWDDVGDWKNVYDLIKKDKDGNAVLKFGTDKGEFIGIESRNNLIQFDDQLIALVGVEDLVVVDAGDIVLVCKKDKAQDVKKMVNLLKEKKREEYL